MVAEIDTKSKLVKNVTDATLLVGLSTAIGWAGKKVLRETFTGDPSQNVMNYGKWVLALTSSIFLKDYLQDKKIIPSDL